jgi:hypothetical protein
MIRSKFLILLLILLCVIGCSAQNPVQADESFETKVKKPTYTKNHPKVLFDEAHRNLHRSDGLFKPFADLITSDGYKVIPNKEKFSAEVLKGFDILVIANARGNVRGESAFTDEECDAIVAWVRSGSSLLLIADHAPFGGFAEKLSKRFGVEMSNSYTDDPPNKDSELGQLLFSRENKLLQDHPITNGRNVSEKINRIVSFTGQSLSIPKDANVILKFSDTAFDQFPNTDKENISAKGKAQMLTLNFGKGKVLISGEAAMLSAQKMENGFKFGMNASKNIDNRQLVLNIMHWLSGLLK